MKLEDDSKMTFGEHQGKRMDEVPSDSAGREIQR